MAESQATSVVSDSQTFWQDRRCYSRGVAPWYNDKLVPAPPWPKVPFAEDWYIEECNCTIGHLMTYRFLTDSDNQHEESELYYQNISYILLRW